MIQSGGSAPIKDAVNSIETIEVKGLFLSDDKDNKESNLSESEPSEVSTEVPLSETIEPPAKKQKKTHFNFTLMD